MATNKEIKVVVITPEKQVLEQTADEVVIPSHDGELGVLNLRAPLMCELGIGQLRYRQGERTERLFVDGGFAQVLENQVIVLTTRAMPAGEVTGEIVAEAEKAIDDHSGHEAAARDARERAQRRATVLRNLRGA